MAMHALMTHGAACEARGSSSSANPFDDAHSFCTRSDRRLTRMRLRRTKRPFQDLVLFVEEALVGNGVVDQLSKFNQEYPIVAFGKDLSFMTMPYEFHGRLSYVVRGMRLRLTNGSLRPTRNTVRADLVSLRPARNAAGLTLGFRGLRG
ncbi:hypothetical protein L3X38_019137 [Prunus dulcis]|uniref:Uncharacterized protein n=1 Tax=Prunus dulcis TaxID=3755 RepID=A0AAD4ZBS5_PRUDU|nr:hypothetical protein L3X38_019137 [Prunus dulcis]